MEYLTEGNDEMDKTVYISCVECGKKEKFYVYGVNIIPNPKEYLCDFECQNTYKFKQSTDSNEKINFSFKY